MFKICILWPIKVCNQQISKQHLKIYVSLNSIDTEVCGCEMHFIIVILCLILYFKNHAELFTIFGSSIGTVPPIIIKPYLTKLSRKTPGILLVTHKCRQKFGLSEEEATHWEFCSIRKCLSFILLTFTSGFVEFNPSHTLS